MKTTKFILGLAAVISLPTQAIAAEQADCISKDEASAVAQYFLPSLMDTGMKSCKAFLPSNAALLVKGPGKMDEYSAASDAAKPLAAKTVGMLIPSDLPAGIGEALALPMVEAVLLARLAGEMDEESCHIFNNIWASLSPLPSQNIGDAMASIMAAVDEGEGENDKNEDAAAPSPIDDIKICRFTATVQE